MEMSTWTWKTWAAWTVVSWMGSLAPAIPRILKANATGMDFVWEVRDAIAENARSASEVITNMAFALFVWIFIWLYCRFYEWAVERMALRSAKFKPSKYKEWFRMYLAIQHGCDHRILDALWLFDNGPHGQSVIECYEELIRDVCMFLNERDFEVRYVGSGWKTSHLEWQISHDDGRLLTIHAEKFQLDPYAAKQSWPSWGRFVFHPRGADWFSISRGWRPNEDSPKETILFRKRIFEAVWDFVDLEKTK